jgi:nitrite reductase/ring-hydroxylating ferredoxin subunit
LSADGERVICHAHGAQFDADNGTCTGGPCLGQSLVALPCRVENGWVWISLPGNCDGSSNTPRPPL